MDMEFNRIPISYLQKLAGQLRSQEETLEVRLPDGMPDIGRVLGAWGQVIVRGKEWNSNHMAVSCGVMMWVLYKPEDGTEVRSVEAWLPFSMKWELPDTRNDGKILISCLLRSADARSISARKLMVRATLGAVGEGWLPAEAQMAVHGELPGDVAVLSATYPVLLPREVGEKAFLLEDQRSVPTSNPKPEKILYYSLQPEIMEKKVMAGKVVFRGIGIVHVLYRGEDGRLCVWDWELPFSQYADLEEEYDQDPTVTVMPCVTSLDISLDENGELQLKAGILSQYLLHDRTMVTVAEDAYSPHRKVTPMLEQLQIPAVLDETVQTVHAEATSQTEVYQMVDATFCPEYVQAERSSDTLVLPVAGQFQMLYYDAEGELCSGVTKWEGQWDLRAEDDSAVSAWIASSGKPQAVQGAGTVALRADVNVSATFAARQGIAMVTGLEMEEEQKPDRNRPSLILCRRGDKRLWDLAKETGSTVEAIMEANGLSGEPESSCVLLVPVL